MAKIFDSFKIKDLEFKNRVIMAPMCMYSSDITGEVKDFHIHHYVTRAIGGVGGIVIEATAVEERGVISQRDLGIWKDEHIDGLKKLVDSVKKNGTPIGIQIAHAGRKSEFTGEIVAPSAIPFDDKSKTPKELSVNEIKEVVEAFKNGARRAVKAGFDFIEIHGAHGYLINEFLSPLSNKRDDEYGGTLEKRAKFLDEVLKEIKEVIPENMPVVLRVSASDFTEGGNTPEDISKIINLVKNYGIDLINVSAGAVVPAAINLYPGYQVKFAEVVKKETGLPVMAGGLILDRNMVEEILGNERSEFVFLARPLLREPYLVLRWAKEVGREDLIPYQYKRGF
ncbi:NADPH dehydrogenase NamA [Clostridium paridis]|uniref:NADPH dehydrogenase NamA n=1 Tax=Clostridium paridis TaxID=2803863 RepID=A0A937FE94_9CLOT|nr:NADPH dehydrogenase NamA [Clostridium paridis]MBL4932229.1 NADPH dehydrogenase NamA [Clostridium paridis]